MLVSANRKTTNYGINSVSHLAPKIWDLVPEEIKNSKSLPMFKTKNQTMDTSGLPMQSLQNIHTKPGIPRMKFYFKGLTFFL